MSNEIELFTGQFRHERNLTTLKSYIEKDEDIARFTAVVVRAVQENPELLQADRTSLFFACQKAAQDHLIPDGKEGFLGIYSVKAKKDGKDVWVKKVQWQPMIGGLRKILANARINIRAEIVYEEDLFLYDQGDSPCIVHKPIVFGKRGDIVGAYAIATNMDTGEIIGRETMDLAELEKVRAASKNPSGNVYTIWDTEMKRKAVAKRLFKQLPLPDSIREVIERDNEQFDMHQAPEVSDVAKTVQEAVRLSKPDTTTKTRYEPPEEPPEAWQNQYEETPLDESTDFAGQVPDF